MAPPITSVSDPLHQIFQQCDLGGDFRPAHHRHQRPLGIAQRLLEMGKFGLHGAARRSRAEAAPAPSVRGMGAMGGGKCVIDENIAQRRQLPGKAGIVLFLAGMEAGIFQQQNLAVLQALHRALRLWSDAVVRERHGAADLLRPAAPATGFSDMDGTTLPLGRSKWLSTITARAFFRQFADGGGLAHDAQGRR